MSSRPHRVALHGFSAFERNALSSYFRLAGHRPAYEQVDDLGTADFIVADADHSGVIDSVLAADRAHDTVFIGAQAPEGALAWMMRPIDPTQVVRQLDAVVALREPGVAQPHRVAPVRDQSIPSRRASDPGAAAPAPSFRRDVLIVDDSEIAQRYLEVQLQRLGLRTHRAGDSAQALALLTSQSFDLVFVDVELGERSELDGLALCRHIKQHVHPVYGHAPVVVIVSAHGSEADRVRGALAGCDEYLTKPLDDAEMRDALSRCGVSTASAAAH